jgi:hypothetical protein
MVDERDLPQAVKIYEAFSNPPNAPSSDEEKEIPQ